MFHPDSSTPGKSLHISDLLLNAKWQRAEEVKVSTIFTPDYFAKDWDSIYVRPHQLPSEEVKEGMRKLVAPTLLITSKEARMAYVLASKDAPVYIPNEYVKDDDFGYLMAFRLSSFITPEYVFYLCEYDYWNKYLTFWAEDGDRFDRVGPTGDFDLETQTYLEYTAEMLVNHLGNVVVPTIEGQKQMVNEAKEAYSKLENLTTISEKELSSIVWKYLNISRGGMFSHSQARIGLLRELYKRAARLSVNDAVVNALSVELYPYYTEAISEMELNILAKNLRTVFPMLINPTEYSWDLQGCFVQPKEVTDFMVKLASIPAGAKVYNPFAGLASFAVALPNNIVVGEEINHTTWAIAQIRMMAFGIDANISNADSFDSMKSGEKYDAIISSPVYLREKGHEIADIVSSLYDMLTDNGMLICLVPHSFLSSKRRSDAEIRERLIADKSIKGIVTIPNNIFTGMNTSQDVIFIQKGNQREDVIMADASGATRFAKSSYRMTVFDWEHFIEDMEEDLVDFGERGSYVVDGDVATLVDYSEIIGTNLTPSIYLTAKPQNGIPLSTIATEVKETRSDAATEYFITGSSIPEAMHRKPYAPVKVNDGKVSTAKCQVEISGDAVIVAMVSGNIRTVYLEGFNGKIAFPNGFIKVLKPTEGINAKYLAALLSTTIVADQIKAQCSNLTIPRLNRLELSQIFVPDYRSEEDREKLISEVLSAEMSDLEGELQETLDKQKREIRSTRHAMIQTLSALSSNWEQLNMFAKLRNGSINLSDTVGRINPISVEKLMGSIGYAISTLQRQVESLRFEKADWGQETEINPYKFINDYIASHSTPEVRMVNVGNDNKADIPDINEETGNVEYYHTDALDFFYAPERLLERIFNNIVANAKAHGFTPDRTKNEIRFDWQTEDGNIVITIANNGAPLKDGVTSDDVLMSGFSTALNENAMDGTLHSGQGGFEIKSLMDNLGKVEIILEPDDEYPVIYKLTFEKTNFVSL